jgi:hypothetical protein
MDGEAEELRDEVRIRTWGLPGALAIALLFHAFGLGQFLQRTFFAMWLHELGHATAAWLCGIPAFPGPWLTPMGAGRSWPFALFVTGSLAFAIWRLRESWVRWLLTAIVLAQLLCTALLRPDSAQVFVIFAGDAGAVVFGTLAMAAIFSERGSLLHRGWLRWGALVIGAASYVDVFSVWWKARTDADVIPFGAIEGVGLSDPSRLTDDYGWSTHQLVSRYVAVGVTCGIALLVLYAAAVLRARASLRNETG